MKMMTKCFYITVTCYFALFCIFLNPIIAQYSVDTAQYKFGIAEQQVLLTEEVLRPVFPNLCGILRRPQNMFLPKLWSFFWKRIARIMSVTECPEGISSGSHNEFIQFVEDFYAHT